MGSIWLYLDDLRTPVSSGWIVVRSYDEFVREIEIVGLEHYHTISLDHDLADFRADGSELTGLDCAKFLVAYSNKHKIELPNVYVHSSNSVGVANIINEINDHNRRNNSNKRCVRIEVKHTVLG